MGLLEEEAVLALLESKPPQVELVLTGRYMPEKLLAKADLITEMKEIRHYYATRGLLARDGIER